MSLVGPLSSKKFENAYIGAQSWIIVEDPPAPRANPRQKKCPGLVTRNDCKKMCDTAAELRELELHTCG